MEIFQIDIHPAICLEQRLLVKKLHAIALKRMGFGLAYFTKIL